ncbi:MAG: cytochrome c [Solirubrobacterales bacterium]|nr:cytochrome c [Solirubrobacterales bacterium]
MARRLPIVALALCAALLMTACGAQGVKLADDDPNRAGAVLFAERCSGCHSLEVAGAQGSASDVGDRERTDGPSFDTRKEEVADVLYAIRNGGFSGAIMPENIATGREAQAIAEFLAEYSGRKAAEG